MPMIPGRQVDKHGAPVQQFKPEHILAFLHGFVLDYVKLLKSQGQLSTAGAVEGGAGDAVEVLLNHMKMMVAPSNKEPVRPRPEVPSEAPTERFPQELPIEVGK